MTATTLTRNLMRAGMVAVLALGIAVAEMKSDGFWFLAIDVAGLIAERLIDAFRWVAAFVAVGFLAWKASAYVTRRDTLQDVARAAARNAASKHDATAHPEARFN